MTIDKAIAKIWHCIVSIRGCIGNKEFVEALELSVEIMRKHQKIQEIIKDWEDGRFSDVVGCLRVKAVLDGNDI